MYRGVQLDQPGSVIAAMQVGLRWRYKGLGATLVNLKIHEAEVRMVDQLIYKQQSWASEFILLKNYQVS